MKTRIVIQSHHDMKQPSLTDGVIHVKNKHSIGLHPDGMYSGHAGLAIYTVGCNYGRKHDACGFCLQDVSDEDSDHVQVWHLARMIVQEMRDANVRLLTIGGGEPLYQPRSVTQLIQAFVAEWYAAGSTIPPYIQVETNGTVAFYQELEYLKRCMVETNPYYLTLTVSPRPVNGKYPTALAVTEGDVADYLSFKFLVSLNYAGMDDVPLRLMPDPSDEAYITPVIELLSFPESGEILHVLSSPINHAALAGNINRCTTLAGKNPNLRVCVPLTLFKS